MANRPKPTRLKVLQGNPSKRPLNKNEPKPAQEIPDCPEHLGAEAREEWKRISVQLFNLGLLSRIDRTALAMYCQSWERWVDAENQLKKTGMILRTPNGFAAINPYLTIARQAMDQMKQYLVEFGMTPAARSRIDTTATTARAASGKSTDDEHFLFGSAGSA